MHIRRSRLDSQPRYHFIQVLSTDKDGCTYGEIKAGFPAQLSFDTRFINGRGGKHIRRLRLNFQPRIHLILVLLTVKDECTEYSASIALSTYQRTRMYAHKQINTGFPA